MKTPHALSAFRPVHSTYLPVLILLVVCLAWNAAAPDRPAAHGYAELTQMSMVNATGFIENKGQVIDRQGLPCQQVKYVLQRGNTEVFLMEQGLSYQFRLIHYPKGYEELMTGSLGAEELHQLEQLSKQIITETWRMNLVLDGANASATISTRGESADYINYYNRDALEVQHFRSVVYHDIYPGIDWVISVQGERVKHEFVLHPGADPAHIQIQYDNHESLHIQPDGGLLLHCGLGRVVEQPPVSYQGHKRIATRFVLKGNLVTFAIEDYDTAQQLVIDPDLQWATYFGGNGTDYGTSSAADRWGNVYLSGYTLSSQGIAADGHQTSFGGSYDAFLAKFDSDGQRQWATYYGGSGADFAESCAVNQDGDVFIAGRTNSSNNIAFGAHQVALGGSNDAFLVKFDQAGFAEWATYYGGSSNDLAYACATDADGNVYLAGFTRSFAGIGAGGHQSTYSSWDYNAFLAKFNSEGQRLWGTYYGDSQVTKGFACATDASGNVYLAGETSATSKIATPGTHQSTPGGGKDAFLVKFNSDGQRQWGTYFGGSRTDGANSCAVDNSGNIYLAGSTWSVNQISTSGAPQEQFSGSGWSDAFLAKFNSDGQQLWGTYLGGLNIEYGRFCAIDEMGNVYMSGTTWSNVQITTTGAHQQDFGGGDSDAFLAKYEGSGQLLWSTYYGGEWTDSGRSCAVDGMGNVYLAGWTNSLAQIATIGAYQENHSGGSLSAYLAKFSGEGTVKTVDLPLSEAFRVFPNPSAGLFAIESPAAWESKAYTVHDLQATVQQRGLWSAGYTTIDLSGLPAGLYVLSTVAGSRIHVARLVKY